MKLRVLALAGVLLGLLAGVVAAFAIPRSSAHDPSAPRAPAPADLGPATVRRVGPPLAFHADVRLRLLSRPRIEARAKDPLGGPDWAVRVFRADRVVRPALRRPGVDPVVGHDLCAQVGRIHRGRFGWLDARGTFRRVMPEIGGGEAGWCGSRLPDLHGQPHLSVLTTITDPARPTAALKTAVVWGVAGTAARRVQLDLGGRAVTAARTRHNAFLVLADGALRQAAVRARITYPHRMLTAPLGADRRLPGGQPSRGPQRLVAQAPDPNGGLPFALVEARGAGDQRCTSTGGRVVGDRAGGVDYVLDTFTEAGGTLGGGCAGGAQLARLFRDHPVLLGYRGGSGDRPEEGGDPGGSGRVARRTQRGLTIFNGLAAPDVVAVTLVTPRDVRTLTPTGASHAIIAVYDGTFPTGAVEVVARFRDGRTHTETLPDLGF